MVTPAELADFAEAAMKLGLVVHAEKVLAAAYDALDDLPEIDLSDAFIEVRRIALMEQPAKLTERQLRFLRIRHHEGS